MKALQSQNRSRKYCVLSCLLQHNVTIHAHCLYCLWLLSVSKMNFTAMKISQFLQHWKNLPNQTHHYCFQRQYTTTMNSVWKTLGVRCWRDRPQRLNPQAVLRIFLSAGQLPAGNPNPNLWIFNAPEISLRSILKRLSHATRRPPATLIQGVPIPVSGEGRKQNQASLKTYKCLLVTSLQAQMFARGPESPSLKSLPLCQCTTLCLLVTVASPIMLHRDLQWILVVCLVLWNFESPCSTDSGTRSHVPKVTKFACGHNNLFLPKLVASIRQCNRYYGQLIRMWTKRYPWTEPEPHSVASQHWWPFCRVWCQNAKEKPHGSPPKRRCHQWMIGNCSYYIFKFPRHVIHIQCTGHNFFPQTHVPNGGVILSICCNAVLSTSLLVHRWSRPRESTRPRAPSRMPVTSSMNRPPPCNCATCKPLTPSQQKRIPPSFSRCP